MQLVSFDIEYNPSTKRIDQYGYCTNKGSARQGSDIHHLLESLEAADVLIGHNILHHDLPVLREKHGFDPKDKPLIDTLFLSSLLFAQEPYHKLVKKYHTRINIRKESNPRLDAQLVLDELLPDLITQWRQTSEIVRQIYYHLLRSNAAFRGFFTVVEPPDRVSVADAIRQVADGLICGNAPIKELVQRSPMELAYALALIMTHGNASALPAWLIHTFPKVNDMLNILRFVPCRHDDCDYCQNHLSAKAGLKTFFGFPAYRSYGGGNGQLPLQEKIVQAGLTGRSFLAVLPTGGGKSLCYQVPALMAHAQKRSLTVAISPLQSLMKDQVDSLKRQNILHAFTINGLVDPISRAQAAEAVETGKAAMLYISPEALRSRTIRRLLLRRNIERIVIDEAHCFSAWGHDFRPDYMYIARFLQVLKQHQPWHTDIPVSCYTATARPEVVADITSYFNERNNTSLSVFSAETRRENLSFDVVSADDSTKFDRLLELLDNATGSVIIYASRVRGCEDLVQKLIQYNYPAVVYHGQLDPQVKKTNQDQFMEGHVNIIVATSAFGMGVDKKDVAHVIHYEISQSLENYVQESGRAGRDPQIHARCHVLYDEEDLQKHFNLLNATRLNKKEIDQIWRAIKLYKRTVFTQSAHEIADRAGWDLEKRDLESRVKTAIAALEEAGYVQRDENATRLFAQSILVKDFESARAIIERQTPGKTEKQRLPWIRIVQNLQSRNTTQVDSIALHLGYERIFVADRINELKDWGILGDATQFTAFVDTRQSKNHSLARYESIAQIEMSLLRHFETAPDQQHHVYLKELHELLPIEERGALSFHRMKRILSFWEVSRIISKTSIHSNPNWLKLRFKKGATGIEQIRTRNKLAGIALKEIVQLAMNETATPGASARAEFTLADIRQALKLNSGKSYGHTELEAAIYYLITMDIITIQGSMLVFYSPMKITRKQTLRKHYTKDDYGQLDEFYQHKIEQVHIVGLYASKMLRSHLEAMHYVDDYFKLAYDVFIQKHFPRRKGKIKKSITEAKFRKIFGDLSTEQEAIIEDLRSERMVVAAGPGSGKTRCLVHKVASLMLMEDIKSEQFLMLTFSRPAAYEMRDRLRKLLGSAYGLDITTFHSYAFNLLGKRGDLQSSDRIISEAINQLASDDHVFQQVSNKEVILVDEFQDINEEQFQFLKLIVEKSGRPRVILVGDDDQNIYAFLGSSVKYFREFAKHPECTQYYLRTNFRSKSNLVDLSNAFLQHMPGDRLKKDIELIPQNNRPGKLEIHAFPPQSIGLQEIANHLTEETAPGTGVLMLRNREILQLYTILRKRGIKVNLLLQRHRFKLAHIIELETFTQWALNHADENIGLVDEDQVQHAKAKLQELFADSSALGLALSAIDMFNAHHPRFFRSEWLQYLQELRLEDVDQGKGQILLSTIHKAKGREFDRCYIYHFNRSLSKHEDWRVLYVALTRARNDMFVFTNNEDLIDIATSHGERQDHKPVMQSPDEITIQVGLGDINLHKVKRAKFQQAIRMTLSGELATAYPATNRIAIRGQYLILSKAFKEKLKSQNKEGYRLENALIDQIVVWRSRDEEYRLPYRVPMLQVVMVRDN